MAPGWAIPKAIEKSEVRCPKSPRLVILRISNGRYAKRSSTPTQFCNRPSLVHDALRECLKRLEMRELEGRDRAGYEKHSDVSTQATDWEQVASWPER